MAESGNINSLNIKLSADPEGLRRGMDDAVKAMQAGGSKMQQQSDRLAKAMNTWQKSVDDAGLAATRKQRALFNLAMGYEQMGKAGQASLKETLKAARENKDAIEDMQMAVQAGTIEGKFQMAARAMSEVTQVMAGAKGAMMAFGINTEDAQEAMAKLQGMMAMSQGIGMMMGLDGAVKALIPSIGAATAGFTGLKAALVSTGIGAVAVAIGFLVAELIDYIDTSDDAKAATEAHTKAQEQLAAAFKETMGNASRANESYLLELEANGATEKELHDEKLKFLRQQLATFEAVAGNEQQAYEARLAIMDEENRWRIKANKEAEQRRAKEKEANAKRLAELKAEKEMYQQIMSNLGDLQTRRELKQVTGPAAKPVVLPVELKFDKASTGKTAERVMAQVSALNSGLQTAMAGTVDNISNLISDMFTAPEDAFRNFGNAMLATLGQFMSQLGKAIIAAGTASDVFQKALLANPGAAIAAGAALVAAGAAVTGMMKKGMNARAAQDTGGGGGTPQGIRPFASGGIVSGPTLGLMGEYAGARSNPEVVAPLDKLKSMLGGSMGGTLTTRVSGTDLLILLDRAERNRGRVR